MSVDGGSSLGRPSARIMLLGTFHFQDRGLDRYQPASGFDVFSAARQREIAEPEYDLVEVREYLATVPGVRTPPAREAG